MAGPGGGPSRRSHTKSRKGCKTCKRRHIRCDETFPQCRNCTRHQVRCDYMDMPTLGTPDSPDGPRTANLLWTPEIEATVNEWRRTGELPFPELRVYPQPSWHTYNKTELRLVHHLASIASNMIRNRTTKLTVWTDLLPKFLQVSAAHEFVMHSLLAFSASHLAWISQSTETRNLAAHYASTASKGLQQAIMNFTRTNADAILAATLLLQWHATDWREWAPLVTSTTKVIHMMKPWTEESLFAEVLSEHAVNSPQTFTNPAGTFITPEIRREHEVILGDLRSSLGHLAGYVAQYEQEKQWIEQLRTFVDRLYTNGSAQTAEEQFQQLFALRTWLFWVPISLLGARRDESIVMMVLSYFYATALALEPVFPDVGGAFCSTFALQPLDHCIRSLDAQAQQGLSPLVSAALSATTYPKDTIASYRNRRWSRQRMDSFDTVRSPYGLENLRLDMDPPVTQFHAYGATTQALSPPTSIPIPPSPLAALQTTVYGGHPSPYMEVPRTSIDFGAAVSAITYSSPVVSSPLVSPTATMPYTTSPEEVYSYGMPMGYPGGFVTTAPTIWT